MKFKKVLRNITTIVGLAVPNIMIGTVLSNCASHPQTDLDIVDRHYSVNELENWQFQSNLKDEDFSSLSSDDQNIMEFFKNNYKPINLLDSIVDYCRQYLNKKLVSESSGAEPTEKIEDVVHKDWEDALNIEYIRMVNPNQYRIDLTFDLKFSTNCWLDDIEILTGTNLSGRVHSQTDLQVSILEAYYVSDDDDNRDIWKGNNVIIGNTIGRDTSFYIDFVLSYDGSIGFDYSVYKNRWSNIRIKGFDNIKLPLINNQLSI